MGDISTGLAAADLSGIQLALSPGGIGASFTRTFSSTSYGNCVTGGVYYVRTNR